MPPRRGVSFDESAIEADRRARAAGEYATQKIDIPDTPFLYYDSDEEAEARTGAFPPLVRVPGMHPRSRARTPAHARAGAHARGDG